MLKEPHFKAWLSGDYMEKDESIQTMNNLVRQRFENLFESQHGMGMVYTPGEKEIRTVFLDLDVYLPIVQSLGMPPATRILQVEKLGLAFDAQGHYLVIKFHKAEITFDVPYGFVRLHLQFPPSVLEVTTPE